MIERTSDYLKYVAFWLVILVAKFCFAYFLQESCIKPLVEPTTIIYDLDGISYSWHDVLSKHNHNALTILSLWAPVFSIYLLDIYVFYTVLSAIVGFLMGARDRLGEIRSVEALHERFEEFPKAFMKFLHVELPKRTNLRSPLQSEDVKKFNAAMFSPFWNQIIGNLRNEDYISNLEMNLLLMPKNSNILKSVQWPLFLLASKVFVAKDIAVDNRDPTELWDRIIRDDYMKFAVQECYDSIILILTSILHNEGKTWMMSQLTSNCLNCHLLFLVLLP
ncbi:hypothetical protein ZOSMA_304G00160 [Zostera marina]|uniref:Callose synthase helical domain-containing protein n=1 Tax=Zostera marina TaxID=29655 RepID=A0A0K9PCI4_ZOSMR|nr:hypothetical protein ZOSMA_304G00160 [Zostera marina]